MPVAVVSPETPPANTEPSLGGRQRKAQCAPATPADRTHLALLVDRLQQLTCAVESVAIERARAKLPPHPPPDRDGQAAWLQALQEADRDALRGVRRTVQDIEDAVRACALRLGVVVPVPEKPAAPPDGKG